MGMDFNGRCIFFFSHALLNLSLKKIPFKKILIRIAPMRSFLADFYAEKKCEFLRLHIIFILMITLSSQETDSITDIILMLC
jgi:hypothetical protein